MRITKAISFWAGTFLIAACLPGLSGVALGKVLTAQGSQTAHLAPQAATQSTNPTPPATPPAEANASDATPSSSNITALKPEQTRAVLDKLFLAESRIKDLLATLQTTSWKITDAERQKIDQSIGAAQQKVQDLEKWRYQFYYHLKNLEDRQNTEAAIRSLEPVAASLGAAMDQYQGATQGSQFQQASQALAGVADQLNPHVAVPEASQKAAPSPAPAAAVAEPAAQPAPQTAVPSPPASKPAETTQAAPPPPSTATTVTPEQDKAALDKLFLAESRIKDLLSTLQTTSWKMTDTGRQEIDQSISSAQQKIQDLERWRYQCYYHLDDLADAQKTQAGIESLQPGVAAIGTSAGQYQGAATAAQFQQASQELASLEGQLQPYVSEMEARMKAPGGGPALETEVIKALPNIKPLNSIVTQPPPLSAAQVKQLLYRVYVAAFRIKDLLSQEQPEKWKAPSAAVNAFNASRRDLLKNLATLEHWRERLSERPADLNSGFQTYVSIDHLLEPLEGVTLRVARYQSPRIAANYQKTTSDLRTQQDDLLPYLTFLFRNHDQAVQMYQTDLVNCQNTLGFAMHGLRPQATLMKNVLPQFQGRNVRKHQPAEKASTAKTGTAKKRTSSHQTRRKRHHRATHSAAPASGH
ncbi:MAG: hypothetical protein ACRD3T_18905 [Terriglobia bacterium]